MHENYADVFNGWSLTRKPQRFSGSSSRDGEQPRYRRCDHQRGGRRRLDCPGPVAVLLGRLAPVEALVVAVVAVAHASGHLPLVLSLELFNHMCHLVFQLSLTSTYPSDAELHVEAPLVELAGELPVLRRLDAGLPEHAGAVHPRHVDVRQAGDLRGCSNKFRQS